MSSATKSARVAVICGGPSAEAAVSRVSGRGVAGALRSSYPLTELFECDADIARRLLDFAADVVFPVMHGPPGEDGTLQGLLEMLGLPYVGSGVHASAAAMDKIVAKHLFRDAGLPVAPDTTVTRSEALDAAVARTIAALGTDLVVKPSRQGSALGVAFARSPAELAGALSAALAFDAAALVESRIDGKEITVGVLERDGLEAAPSIEIRTPPNAWYDYEHRYTQGLSEHLIPAKIEPDQEQAVRDIACRAHAALGCRDLSRADFVVPASGSPILLEVNTIPGMTPTSLYPDAANALGLDFEALVIYLVERALARSNDLFDRA